MDQRCHQHVFTLGFAEVGTVCCAIGGEVGEGLAFTQHCRWSAPMVAPVFFFFLLLSRCRTP